jgi:hypothetical protein
LPDSQQRLFRMEIERIEKRLTAIDAAPNLMRT